MSSMLEFTEMLKELGFTNDQIRDMYQSTIDDMKRRMKGKEMKEKRKLRLPEGFPENIHYDKHGKVVKGLFGDRQEWDLCKILGEPYLKHKLQNFLKVGDVRDQWGKFISDAINEKIEREMNKTEENGCIYWNHEFDKLIMNTGEAEYVLFDYNSNGGFREYELSEELKYIFDQTGLEMNHKMACKMAVQTNPMQTFKFTYVKRD